MVAAGLVVGDAVGVGEARVWPVPVAVGVWRGAAVWVARGRGEGTAVDGGEAGVAGAGEDGVCAGVARPDAVGAGGDGLDDAPGVGWGSATSGAMAEGSPVGDVSSTEGGASSFGAGGLPVFSADSRGDGSVEGAAEGSGSVGPVTTAVSPAGAGGRPGHTKIATPMPAAKARSAGPTTIMTEARKERRGGS